MTWSGFGSRSLSRRSETRGRRRHRFIGWLTTLAIILALSLVAGPSARADTTGTPPNIIDYNTVDLGDQGAVGAFEHKAAQEVLLNHSLPDSDFDAVRGWARNQVRTQMWADLVVIMKKSQSARTADEQKVYNWFQHLVHQSNIRAAQASVDEFIKYSGLTPETYTTAEPVNFNNADKNQATGGYCVYRAPGPYADSYFGYLDQTCFTAQVVPLNFAIPMPSYDEFVAFGQYQANKAKFGTPGFSRTAFEVAASLSVGASLALLGAALPIGFALSSGVTLGATATAIAQAVFPYAVRAGTAAAVGAGAVAGAVATAVTFVVVVVLTSIQVDAQLRMGQRLKSYLDKVTSTPPDLRGYLLSDEARAADTTKSADERKPKYYPGFFSTFLTATLPEADPEPCSGGLVIGGSVYQPGCVNAPAPPAVAVDDPVFSVTQQGSATAVQTRWISHDDPYHARPTLSRASGKGWFVESYAAASTESQSLALYFTGWDGKSYYAERIWDAPNGYRFAITPVRDGATANDASVSDAINFVQPGGGKATARIVPSSVSSLTVNIPDHVNLNEPQTFSAVATGAGVPGLSFIWWFPRHPDERFGEPPAGVPSGYLDMEGATVSRSFDTPGAVDVYLQISAQDGTSSLQRRVVNVIDNRLEDPITLGPASDLRVGDVEDLDIRSASGTGVNLRFPPNQETCGMPDFFNHPHRLNGVHTGHCTVIAYTSGTTSYQPSELQIELDVFKGPQSITGGSVTDGPVGAAQQVTATASSGLQVSVTVDAHSAAICSVSGTTVTGTALGTCDLTLRQPGDVDYQPAVPQSRSFQVNQAGQAISFDELPDLAYHASRQLVASSTSGLPVTITVDPASSSVCSVDGTTVHADALGACSLTATQPGDDTYLGADPVTRTFQVIPAPLTITATDETTVYGHSPDYGYTSSDPSVLVAGVTCTAGTALDVGEHEITCSGGDAGPNYAIGYAAATLTVTPSTATVTVTPPVGQYSDPVPQLNSTWSAEGLLAGDHLTGTLAGCSPTGLVAPGGVVTSPAGTFALSSCTGLTNANYEVGYRGSFVVTPEDASVEFTGGWAFSTNGGSGADAALSAKVTQAADGSMGDITLATVEFLLFKSTNLGNTPDFSATGVPVDGVGNASTTFAALPADAYRLVVQLSPSNQHFAGPAATDQVAVYQPVAGASVNGGGWVRDSNAVGGKGRFSLAVRYTKEKVAEGKASFTWRNPANGYDYLVTSTSWRSGGLAFSGSTASLSSGASLTVIDPATGMVVPRLSGDGYNLRMVATDRGSGKSLDTFAVSIRNSAGVVIHSVGVPTPVSVGGGSISVSP